MVKVSLSIRMPLAVCLLPLCAPLCALAQVICALGTGATAYKSTDDQRPSPDAMQVAIRVNAAMKPICADQCPQLAIFRNATAANLMLVLVSGQAKIAYAPPFFGAVYNAYGDNGIAAVLAHELGHALDDTMGAAWVNQKSAPELRADGWVGCILSKMILKDAELSSSLKALAKYPSPAHPAWAQRLLALRTGYTNCGGSAAVFDKKR